VRVWVGEGEGVGEGDGEGEVVSCCSIFKYAL
jgi:hypothetical protein